MKSAGSGPKNNHVCGSREQINANEEELHKDKDEKEVDGVRGRVAGPHIFGEMKDQQKTRRPAFCFSISVLFYIFSRFLFRNKYEKWGERPLIVYDAIVKITSKN
eukprot:GEMP01123482.1.p1 GENE.GEMP01123482.1~~GEMP01123482.1.p1  ORF type:complete len:105 (+),score=12.93 GEMP01123482.1:250-564(+)